VRVLVVGAGAVGGLLGGRMAQAGLDVTFLVRPPRAERLNISGLSLIAPGGSRSTIPVVTVTADRLEKPYDVVLLAVKGNALDQVLSDLTPAVGDQTVVIPLLNGISHLGRLTRSLGVDHVLGGVCLVATELTGDGAIRQLAPGASICLGELNGHRSPRLLELADRFAATDFDVSISDTIEQDMWEKWFFMAAGGATTVLLGGSVGDILRAEDGTTLVREIIAEATKVMRAEGREVRPAAHHRVSSILTTAESPFTTSLYRDLRAGRPTEVEPVLGDLLRLAAANGTPCPLLRAAAVRLRVENIRDLDQVGNIRTAGLEDPQPE
jgi:2-dehydropantoate 2-reductase